MLFNDGARGAVAGALGALGTSYFAGATALQTLGATAITGTAGAGVGLLVASALCH